MTLSMFYFLVQQTMFYSIPLLIVALGGMYSERSGIVNISLEGIMIFGALFSTLFLNFIQKDFSGQWILIVALLIALFMGIILSYFHALASIDLKANQVISGTALNLFAFSFAGFLPRLLFGTENIPFKNTFRIEKIPYLSDIPVLGDMFFTNTYITTFVGFGILLIATFVLYKTRFGLRLRSCGEKDRKSVVVGKSVFVGGGRMI